MKDVTIVIVCYQRYGSLKRCLRSIRKLYPDINIIISDNGNMKTVPALARHFGCEHLDLPFDSGANFARQQGQKAVKTKYWVIGEDDFIFTKDTILENFRTVLDHDQEVDLVGGLAIRGNRLGTIGSTFTIDRKRETFFRDPVRDPVFRIVDGVPYYLCDFVRMFFMARKEVLIDWEVGKYEGSGSHISICVKNFLNKQEALKERIGIPGESLTPIWPWYQMAFTHSVAVSHFQVDESPEYRINRSRVRNQMSVLYDETGLRYGVFDMKRVRDYKDQRSISMDEWRRRTQS